MKQTDKNVLDISKLSHSEALEAQRIQREYEERTFWRKDIIWTWAKAISVTSLSFSSAIALILVVRYQDSGLLEKMLNIIACVLSFFAGRSTRR